MLRQLFTSLRHACLIKHMCACVFSVVLLLSCFTSPALKADDATLTLTIQPFLSEAHTHETFQPLADYISAAVGKRCIILTRPNFIIYWSTLYKGKGYDLVFDEAHFTDYRIKKLDFSILVKAPNAVSYSLVVNKKLKIYDPAELIGKRVATLGIPSIGAAQLNGLFPNPVRQPTIVEVDNSEEGISLLLKGHVVAAILPTPFVAQQMKSGKEISVVLATEPMPNMALSAAPSVPAELSNKLRSALLKAHKTEAGKKMLASLGYERFDLATPAIYAGKARILEEYWGY